MLNILLQVLDDGHITDAQGRKVSFKNTIIIMTSNAGAEQILTPKRLGFDTGTQGKDHDYNVMKSRVMEEVRHLFKPEFLNRVDEIIVFHPITKENMRAILDIMMKELETRARSQMNLRISLDDKAKDWLIDKGFDPKFGARPLRRTIQTEIEDLLSEKVLDGTVSENASVHITVGEDKNLKLNVRKTGRRAGSEKSNLKTDKVKSAAGRNRPKSLSEKSERVADNKGKSSDSSKGKTTVLK